MCVILDANMYGRFLNQQDVDMEPVRDWVNKHGKIAYSPTRKMEKELGKFPKMKQKFGEYRRAGKLKQVKKDQVDAAVGKLELGDLQSNDSHIIALAKCGNFKVLISEDQMLHRDFKEKAHGKVYQYKSQKHLLKKDTCP